MEKSNERVHKKRKKELSASFYAKIFIVLAAALIIFTSYTAYQTSSIRKSLDERVLRAQELVTPAEIQLITITDPDCEGCFDISPTVSGIKGGFVNITKEDELFISSERAKELIGRYSIERIPTVMVFGDLSKLNIRGFDESEDALVFTGQTLPYTDAESGAIQGRVTALILEDPACDKCPDLSIILNQLKQAGVKIVSEEAIDTDTEEGQDLVAEYSLEVLPTLILSSDMSVYDPQLLSNWENIGSVEEDGSFVMRRVGPPYLNVSTGKIEGLVSVIYLVDETCEGCYDPKSFHSPILVRLGVVPEEENEVSVSSSEGQSLVEEYSIQKVPTLILTGNPGKYPGLVNAWKDVGTIDLDGTYVFRSVELAGRTYKNLVNDSVIELPLTG